MKILPIFAIVFLSACNATEDSSENLKTMQSYKIYMTGNYTSVDTDCSQALLTLGKKHISENKIICDLDGFESTNNGITPKKKNCAFHEFTCDLAGVKLTSDGITLLEGKKCTAAGYKISDFSFYVNHSEDGTITYRSSDETVWQKLKKCPAEKQME